jgi:hypothetical protein
MSEFVVKVAKIFKRLNAAGKSVVANAVAEKPKRAYKWDE